MMKRFAFAITATMAGVLGGLALFIFLGVITSVRMHPSGR